MIKLCVFDMGGVVVRNYDIVPRLLEYLGRRERRFTDMAPAIGQAITRHNQGLINEDEFWSIYQNATGDRLPGIQGSLLGHFFKPQLDAPTVAVLEGLRQRGIRVVCGTNVSDAHYQTHIQNGDYRVFDKVYASHLIQLCKPDPAFYRFILDAEELRPEEVFFTDDAERNVKAGSDIGLQAFLYTGAEELKKQLSALSLNFT